LCLFFTATRWVKKVSSEPFDGLDDIPRRRRRVQPPARPPPPIAIVAQRHRTPLIAPDRQARPGANRALSANCYEYFPNLIFLDRMLYVKQGWSLDWDWLPIVHEVFTIGLSADTAQERMKRTRRLLWRAEPPLLNNLAN
jgi:hypothetical protein